MGQSAGGAVRAAEASLEGEVSRYLGALPFVWVEIDDPPAKDCGRDDIERNAIGLLSQAVGRETVDPPSEGWLGWACPHRDMGRSGFGIRGISSMSMIRGFCSDWRGMCAAQSDRRGPG